MKFVVIVDEGQWGDMQRTRGDYDVFNRSIMGALDARPGEENEGQVKVVADVRTALEEIGSEVPDSAAVLVFTTRGMVDQARDIKKTHPELRIVVLTGLAHDLSYPELVIADKGKIAAKPETLRAVILGE